MTRTAEPERTVARRVSERLGWPESEFVERLFFRCIPWWVRGPAWLVQIISPSVFVSDREALADAARATTARELRNAAQDLSQSPRRQHRFIRDTLGVRCSGRRLLAIVKQATGGLDGDIF